MAAPASETLELLKRLSDYSLNLSEFELHRTIKDVGRLLAKGVTGEQRKAALATLSQAHYRLGHFDGQLRANREMFMLDPSPDVVVTYSMSLANIRDYETARKVLEGRVQGLPKTYKPTALVMLAVVYGRLGEVERAHKALREAAASLDYTNPEQLLTMATASVELGMPSDGIELFARYLSLQSGQALGAMPALEFIYTVNRTRPEMLWILDRMYPLRAAIVEATRARELASEVEKGWGNPEGDDDEVAEAFGALRDEATEADSGLET